MPRGGTRVGAGRPKGSKNKKTRAIAATAAKEGITPLEVMLQAMRDEYEREMKKTATDRDLTQAALYAKDAAPYCHPRLSAVAHGTTDDLNRRPEQMPALELARRVGFLFRLIEHEGETKH